MILSAAPAVLNASISKSTLKSIMLLFKFFSTSSTTLIKEHKNGGICPCGAILEFLLSARIYLPWKSAVSYVNSYTMIMPAAQDTFGNAISYFYGH